VYVQTTFFPLLAHPSTAPGNRDDQPPDVQGNLDGKYTGLDESGEHRQYRNVLISAYEAIADLSEGRNKVLAVTSGHDHGNSYCAKSRATKDMNLWCASPFHM
jgi:hypothetical protein